MNRIRIRGPPGGRLDEALTSLIARFLSSFIHFTKENTSMTTTPNRSLLTILAELSATLQTLADQQNPPIPLDEELEMANRALQGSSESLAFRAIEVLVLNAHASGLMKEPAVQQAPAYIEAVQVLRMSGKDLPADL